MLRRGHDGLAICLPSFVQFHQILRQLEFESALGGGAEEDTLPTLVLHDPEGPVMLKVDENRGR